MSGGHLDEEEWERIFRLKRHMESLMEQHTLADVMARERLPYLATEPGTEGNRHARRAAARKTLK